MICFILLTLSLFFFQLSEIKSEMEKINDAAMKQQLNLIEQSLKVGGFLSDVQLEDFITQTIVRNRRPQDSFKSRERSFVKGYRSRNT